MLFLTHNFHLSSLQPTAHLVATTRASHSWTFPNTSLRGLLPSRQCNPKRSHTSTNPCHCTTTYMPPSPSPSPLAIWSTHASPRPPRTRCSAAQPLKPGSQLAAMSKGRPPPRGTPPPPCTPLPPCTPPTGDTATQPVGNRA